MVSQKILSHGAPPSLVYDFLFSFLGVIRVRQGVLHLALDFRWTLFLGHPVFTSNAEIMRQK